MKVVLLHVLAVIALRIGEAGEALLQDRVSTVPQRHGQAEPLAVVAHAGDTVFAPAIGPRPSLVMGEVAPGVTALAVVLANGAPLPIAQIGAPSTPRGPSTSACSKRRPSAVSFIVGLRRSTLADLTPPKLRLRGPVGRLT